jgi:type IV fimbrial biogenesis protein FimT
MKPRMSKLMPRFSRGMTLIEVMIAMAIVVVLVAMAVQGFSGWTRDMSVRGAAESILSGLQTARAEALKRNTPMRFQLVTTLGSDCALSKTGPHWVVSRDVAPGKCGAIPANPSVPADPPAEDSTPAEDTEDTEDTSSADVGVPFIVQKYDGTNALKNHIVIDAQNEEFTFDAMGRLSTIDAAEDIVIGVKEDDKWGSSMRIQLTPGGGVRMCNPGSNIDAQKC